jgi:hypothetical protein
MGLIELKKPLPQWERLYCFLYGASVRSCRRGYAITKIAR